ncbi:MAG: SpoIIE family protein phosphatase [Clostridia bacterium]|nr:SpoIIE family protein phosphatase [Clostridia bacterium]
MIFEEKQNNDTISVKYSKLDNIVQFLKNIISFKFLVYSIILFISSSVEILGYRPVPYIMLGVATLFKIPLLLPGILSVVSMSVFGIPVNEIMLYVFINMAYAITTVIIKVSGTSRKASIGLKLSIAMITVFFIKFILKGFDVLIILDGLSLTFLTQALYYVYAHGFYGIINIDKNILYSLEETISMVVVTLITTIVISSISIGGVSLWIIAAYIMTILISYTGNVSSGIATSIIVGAIVAITTKETDSFILLTTIGVVTSLLNRVNKLFTLVGVILSSFVITYVLTGSMGLNSSMMEVIIASLIILLLPKKITIILEDVFNKNNTLKSAYEKELGVGSDVKNKLSAMSEVFDNLSNITLESTKENYEETQRVIIKYLTDYKETNCLACNRRYYCLKDNMELVTGYVARKLESNDEIRESMLAVECDESEQMIREIKDIYNNMKLMRIIKEKEKESNLKLANEYREVSKIIKNMAREVQTLQKDVSHTQKCIRQELKMLGYKIYEDVYTDNNDNKIYEFITDIIDNKETSKQEIQNVVGEVIGQKMNIKLILNSSKNEKSRIKLISDSKYLISSELFTQSKVEGIVSGDSYYMTDLKDGGKVITISDGMGSGEEASKVSKSVIEIVDKMFASGFGSKATAKTINAIMKLKENSNISATFDMTIIDTKIEEIEIVKLGAPPTFIISNGKVQKIEKENMPVGLTEIDKEITTRVKLNNKMIIINMSDGVNHENLKEYFNQLAKSDFDFVRKKDIIEEIKKYANMESINDDVTIIVTKVE